MDNSPIVVGLDIGTTKICTIVGRRNEHGKIDILGFGKTESLGVSRGVVTNIGQTIDSIKRSLQEAAAKSGVEISNVFVGIAGQHIKSLQHHGMVTRSSADDEITQDSIDAIVEDMKKLAMPPGEQIIHVIPQEYVVDNETGIKDPIGMAGIRVEANCHIITGQVTAVKNINRCVKQAGLNIDGLFLEPLASADAVLSVEEKEAGVCLVDIGGGTTDIAIYCQGSIRHTAVIPIAGDQITNDIAMALRTPTIDAEDLKIAHGIARQEMADPAAMIDVPGVGDREPRPMSKQALAAVIEPRVEELFTLVRGVVRDSGYEDMVSSGIVLTGGTALMPGMVELAEQVFLRPARIGTPEYRGHLHEVLRSPRFATSIGLLMEGQAQVLRGRRVSQSGALQGVITRMKEWFAGNF